MKIREITSVFKIFEVGEPQGAPEDPFGQGQPPTETQNGLDIDSMMPGGGDQSEDSDNDLTQEQETEDTSQEMPDPMSGGDQPLDMDPHGDEQHEISSKLIDFAKNHPFFSDHNEDEHDGDPAQLLSLGKDQLKQEANNVRTQMASITVNTDAGFYANKDYQYLRDKLSFLKDLIKHISK